MDQAKKPKKQSGTNRSYAERKAKGQPNVTLSLPSTTLDDIIEMAAKRGISRSVLVVLAVDELKRRGG